MFLNLQYKMLPIYFSLNFFLLVKIYMCKCQFTKKSLIFLSLNLIWDNCKTVSSLLIIMASSPNFFQKVKIYMNFIYRAKGSLITKLKSSMR